MLLSHIKRLCTLLPSLIAVSAQNTGPASSIPTSLPASIQRAVPACAQPCLQASLFSRFPTACTSPIDLSCLCSRYSSIGESLGEVALACIYSSCPTVDNQAGSAYNICLGLPAVKQTRTALTVTAASFTETIPMASSSSIATSTTTSKPVLSIRTSVQPQPTTLNTVFIESTPASSTSISSLAPSQTAVPAANRPAPSMKPAQIAGLSVAAAATFIIAICLMALSVFLRRRRERRAIVRVDEEKRNLARHYSVLPSTPQNFPPSAPPKQFPIWTPPKPQGDTAYSNPYIKPFEPSRTIYTAPALSSPPRRPTLGQSRTSYGSSVPLDQIGVAISAELEAKPAGGMKVVQPPRRASLRPEQRPDSVMTQNTVFEEDVAPVSDRASKLLPTPPLPIPPIRSLQPSRPVPNPNFIKKTIPQMPNRISIQSGPSLSSPKGNSPPEARPLKPLALADLTLRIPVRHSREVLPRKAPEPQARPNLLQPPIHISSVYSEDKSRATSVASSNVTGGDIPDYYFMNYSTTTPKEPVPNRSLRRVAGVRPQNSPKLVSIKPKLSSSNVSRATSRASTNVRDSVSSQTSFESLDSNDPTPEDEDDRQLSDDNKLSPVAESPISNLRYPKVPRASNQLVPRSPRSPLSPSSGEGSPRHLPEPSSLLVKRRGEQEALRLESRFVVNSSRTSESSNRTARARGHTRNTSVETATSALQDKVSARHTRILSGQWMMSPDMYDSDVVHPLNVRSRQAQRTPDSNDLKSPLWVPNLTPKRHGDDLFLSVSYSKPAK